MHRVNTPLVTDRTHVATCACGTSLAQGSHRMCAGEAALHHSARVADHANQLLNRMHAIILMGTLDGELRPLSA